MPAYGFAHLHTRRHHQDVLDYLARIQDTLTPFDGRFLVHGQPTEVMEGRWPGSMVLIEFPDLDRARAWYRSPAYQEILPLRTDHIDGDVVLADGVGPDYDPLQRAQALIADALRAAGEPTH
ncbi:DUF1330 domain-containing protein [Nocardia takedensis]|uniref:DUF1330 domain-containing protein n=1 Tax=Nocardia takedensis TaxID=259390 RepID=UPI0002FA465B|nr:DUF1330 domain-containing protein [Nocardia takedensis]